MATLLPPHILNAIGGDQTSTQDELNDIIDRCDYGSGAVYSDDGKQTLKSSIGRHHIPFCCEGHELKNPCLQWTLQSFDFDGMPCAKTLVIPDASITSYPPTDAEEMLIDSWITDPSISDLNGQLKRNSVIIEWQQGSLSEECKAAIRSFCCIPDSSPTPLLNRVWNSATSIDIRSTSKITDTKGKLFRNLFQEVATETTPRWRFLSIYRILEHGYLNNIFDDITARFQTDPKATLKIATDALSSEMEQLIKLIESNGLKPLFEAVYINHRSLIASGNRYSILVEREATAKRNYNDDYKKGASVFYQIRCSIVHAGSHSVIFDRVADANRALEAHLPDFEKIAIDFLGIRFV